MALGWAVVSPGSWPDRVLAPSINAARDAELIAVCGRDMSRAEAFAQRHGASAAYDSLGEMLKDTLVEVVYIASPNHLHAPYTRSAAEAGKHVLVEKPMAVTVADAVEMVRTCRDRGVKLGVGFESVHHPGCRKARDLIGEGLLGTVSLAQAQFGHGIRGVVTPPARTGINEWWNVPEMVGGASAMMGLGVHAVNTLRFLLGQEVVEVASITDGHTPEKPLENLATILLRFDGGAIGMAACGSRMPGLKADAVVYGSNGRVVLENAMTSAFQGKLEVASETVNTTEEYTPDPLGLATAQVEAFNRAVLRDEEPSSSGLDGLRVVEVTVAMIEAATTGRTVKVEAAAI